MKNIKVRSKLLVGFIIVAAFAVIVGAIGIVNMGAIDNSYTSAIDTHAKPLENAALLLESIHSMRAEVRAAILFTGDTEKVGKQEALLNDLFKEFEANIDIYAATIKRDDAKALMDEAKKQYGVFKSTAQDVVAKAKTGVPQSELITIMATTMKPAADTVGANVKKCSEIKSGMLDTTSEAASNREVLSVYMMIGSMAIAAALSIVLALYISGLVVKPLEAIAAFMKKAGSTGNIKLEKIDVDTISAFTGRKDELGELIGGASVFVKHVTEASELLEKIAEKDLTSEIAVASDQDVLGVSLMKMEHNLTNILLELDSIAHQVEVGTSQIAEGAQALAHGSTEQAASVEELSGSIAEIAKETKENAELAEQAATLATDIMHKAEKGSTQMDEMIKAVNQINEASRSVSQVIKVIDDIAFQTNILALNAAVEAARAGQHGKGFAVVAEEVRNLAAKSAEAAKSTGDLIANSMEKAKLGTQIAGETSGILTEIVDGINDSGKLIAHIAQLSVEQSEGITQINIGIEQVAHVIQQNSATAEESAASSEQLSGQVAAIEGMIESFKLKS